MEESLIYSHHCANLVSELSPCQMFGRLACSGCQLVAVRDTFFRLSSSKMLIYDSIAVRTVKRPTGRLIEETASPRSMIHAGAQHGTVKLGPQHGRPATKPGISIILSDRISICGETHQPLMCCSWKAMRGLPIRRTLRFYLLVCLIVHRIPYNNGRLWPLYSIVNWSPGFIPILRHLIRS